MINGVRWKILQLTPNFSCMRNRDKPKLVETKEPFHDQQTTKLTRLIPILLLVGISLFSLNFLSISKQEQPSLKHAAGYQSFADQFILVRSKKTECILSCYDETMTCIKLCETNENAKKCMRLCRKDQDECNLECGKIKD